jgi:hypothetical protein
MSLHYELQAYKLSYDLLLEIFQFSSLPTLQKYTLTGVVSEGHMCWSYGRKAMARIMQQKIVRLD